MLRILDQLSGRSLKYTSETICFQYFVSASNASLLYAESPGTLAYLTLSLSGYGTGQLFLSSELEREVAKMQLSRGAYLQKER